MEVILGRYNEVNANGRVIAVGSKDNLIQMINDAKKRQGGMLISEFGNPTIKPGETNDDYEKRVYSIDLANRIGTFDNIVVEEVEQTNDDIKYPILVVKAELKVNEVHKEVIGPKANFCLRALSRSDQVMHVITWDYCLDKK